MAPRRVIPTDEFFPHMARGIGASDRGHQGGAGPDARHDIMDDPDKAGRRFRQVRTGVEGQGRQREGRVYTRFVYRGQKVLGEINAERLEWLQDFYLAKGLVQRKSPVADLYTGAFIR